MSPYTKTKDPIHLKYSVWRREILETRRLLWNLRHRANIVVIVHNNTNDKCVDSAYTLCWSSDGYPGVISKYGNDTTAMTILGIAFDWQKGEIEDLEREIRKQLPDCVITR